MSAIPISIILIFLLCDSKCLTSATTSAGEEELQGFAQLSRRVKTTRCKVTVHKIQLLTHTHTHMEIQNYSDVFTELMSNDFVLPGPVECLVFQYLVYEKQRSHFFLRGTCGLPDLAPQCINSDGSFLFQ